MESMLKLDILLWVELLSEIDIIRLTNFFFPGVFGVS